MDIQRIIANDPDALLVINARDLHAFSLGLLAQAKSATMTQHDVDPLLTSCEVKKLLGISDSTLYRRRQAGILVPVKGFGNNKYRLSDVNKLIHK